VAIAATGIAPMTNACGKDVRRDAD